MYYGPGFKIQILHRDDINGEPIERAEIPLINGTKNVLLVLKVNPAIATTETLEKASEFIGGHCDRMTTSTTTYHGIVLIDNEDFKLDIVEIEDEVTQH